MAISKLLLSHIRRSRPLSSVNSLPYACVSHLLTNPSPFISQPLIPSRNPHGPSSANSITYFRLFNNRSFSTQSNDDSEFFSDSATMSAFESKLPEFGVNEVTEAVVNGSSGDEESILPVRALISLLDGFHDLTGLPWWVVIASATVCMRVSLLPLLVLQLNKLKTISELFPKLPPPFAPPLSGRSYIDQISLFRKERRAIGCPSPLWVLAYVSVQVPCFLLWMTSIRQMSLNHHPGFDCGGTLWFRNLTELPHGVLSPIFPLLIASLHYINVQLSFEKFSDHKIERLSDLIYYKLYLDLLSLPLFFIGYCIPQGSLVYWITNSSLSVIQQLSFKHPTIRAKLGLPVMESQTAAPESKELGIPERTTSDAPSNFQKVSIKNLSPKKLLAISVQLVSGGHRERAIPLLQLAIQKDPNYIEALVVMGQTMLQKEMYAEAKEYLENAISKLFLDGHPTEIKYADLLILASQWAGVACIRQGKNAEGILHLERVANLEEPEDPKSKVHYFDSLVFLASALYNEGRKAEAIKHLRLAVAYNPTFKELLEQCENEDEEFGSDLVNSRKRDY